MERHLGLPIRSNSKNDRNHVFVGIGELILGFPGDILRIPALGSCIGLVIYPKTPYKTTCAVMGHIMLPKSDKRRRIKNRNPAKYADEAVPAMIELLMKRKYQRKSLVSKMVGGATMFGQKKLTFEIGKLNVKAVKSMLKIEQIPLIGQLIGGDTGMIVDFDVERKQLAVKPTGKKYKTIGSIENKILIDKVKSKQDFSSYFESSKGFDTLKDFLSKYNIQFTNQNKTRIVRRLRLIANKYDLKNYSEILRFFQKKKQEFNLFLTWSKKALVFNSVKKEFLPLISSPISNYEPTFKNSDGLNSHFRRSQSTNVPLVISQITNHRYLSSIFEYLRTKDINYHAYKRSYFLRRLQSRMRRKGIFSYKEYLQVLTTDLREIDLLIENLSINVTNFFRDREVFLKIRDLILPEIFSDNSKIVRIWSAGCAIGAEALSTAILVNNLFGKSILRKTYILGSDIKEQFIAQAKSGFFKADILTELTEQEREEFFTKTKEGLFEILSYIKKSVIFMVHDLRNPPPEKNFDLILCRNVLIYFSKEQNNLLFKRFYSSLNKNAYLVLGKCELLPYTFRDRFRIIDTRNHIYQKI